MVRRVTINPYDFPVRRYTARYRTVSIVLHVFALVVTLAGMAVSVAAGPAVSMSVRLLAFVMVMFGSFALSAAVLLSLRASRARMPRRALVHLADRRWPVPVRLKLDLDLPEYSFRAYRRGKRWTPPTLVTAVAVNDLSPGQTLILGHVVINYEQAVKRFRHRCRR